MVLMIELHLSEATVFFCFIIYLKSLLKMLCKDDKKLRSRHRTFTNESYINTNVIPELPNSSVSTTPLTEVDRNSAIEEVSQTSAYIK